MSSAALIWPLPLPGQMGFHYLGGKKFDSSSMAPIHTLKQSSWLSDHGTSSVMCSRVHVCVCVCACACVRACMQSEIFCDYYLYQDQK